MHRSLVSSDDPALRLRARGRISNRTTIGLTALLVATLAAGNHLAGLPDQPEPSRTANGNDSTATAHPRMALAASARDFAQLLQPTPSMAPNALIFRPEATLDTGLRLVARAAAPEPVIAHPVASPQPLPLDPSSPSTLAPERTAELPYSTVPLPVPRPADLRAPPARLASRQSQPQNTTTVPAASADNRSFFEKIFSVQQPAGPALAYAAPDSAGIDLSPSRRLNPAPNPAVMPATAVYNISARTVTLPNGEVLEAHSGLGDKKDDPSFVHLRMRGATPPGTYDLKEREALFHGVRAIRMNPVGGSAAIHGRSGILAHTYMLGPNGDSNGCISFKDYNRFLQAYLRGDIRRIVVVSGRGEDAPPQIASRRTGRRIASAAGGA